MHIKFSVIFAGDELYTLNDDKICRLCAEVLLKPAGKFNLSEFLTIWQQSVPEGKWPLK